MSSEQIPFIRPAFPSPGEIAADFADIAASNWYTNHGPVERRLADALAAYIGQGAHATTSASGTTALVAAVTALLGQGDRSRYVVMPSFTFVAVAQSVLWCGYRPLFIDVDELTLQPSLAAGAEALQRYGKGIAGILLCNTFGVGNPSIQDWETLAQADGVPLIIDSAAGFGSHYGAGEPLGARGNCEIFSLHATKPLAVGEGGAVAAKDADLIARIEAIQNFGFDGRDSAALGFNGKLAELPAAIGLRQLATLDARIATRRAVLERFRVEFTPLGLTFQPNAEQSSLCFASVLCPSAEVKARITSLTATAGIGCRDYYNPPIHRQNFFATNPDGWAATELSSTEDVCARIVSLPLHDDMAAADVTRIVDVVRAAGR